VAGEIARMLDTYVAMTSATIATGVLLALALVSARALRRVLPYEVWHFTHMFSYLVLLLVYGHQFGNGEQFLGGGFAPRYWTVLYLFVIACVVQGRIVAPVRLNRRHRLRVDDIAMESDDIFSIYITGHRLEELEAKAGQFFRWRFLARGCWWQAHPFSLSASPNGLWLRLTIKVVGTHTARLRMLPVGVRVYVEGPSGRFTSDRGARARALLIAAGSGIGPVRALLEELPRGAVVIYRARSDEDLVFRDELELLAQARGADVWFVVGPRRDPDSRYVLTARGLRELVPDVAYRDVYLCGPEGLTTRAVAALRRLGVPERQIHIEGFEF
jgi:predicted ferric reductase